MKSVNKVILIGNVTRDPQLKSTTSNQPVVTFGLATNREWTTKESEHRSLAEYHNIAAWGRLAEICHQYIRKGKLIYVEGYLKTRSWDSPEGTKMFRTEIVMQDMIMLSKRSDGGDATELDSIGTEMLPEEYANEEIIEEKEAGNKKKDTNLEGEDLNF